MTQPLDPTFTQAMTARCIGSPRGGRVLAVAGHPTQKATFYFGACAGGVWKTEDAGTYWENISDDQFTTAAVGAMAVSEADPNVIYVGTGEATLRGDVSWGDGVYKSTDGGRTWTNMGLADTHHIGRIRIHPANPDIVYVAALGHAFGPNDERGVFRSQDGGASWEKVLFVSPDAGAVDLSLDLTNPRILYASIYQVRRNFWSLTSGGRESGLWKSTDGGDSWTELTGNPGLPEGLLGKIGVTVSPANPQRVWAIIEAKDGAAGVYRSDDGGDSWSQLTGNRDLIQRPWYYNHIDADPQDPDTVYIQNLKMWKSTDGGKNYSEITTPHGDNHALWIDPRDPQRMVQGNDGGANVSLNGGATWSTIYNQMTSQYYHVTTDNQYPYRVYGTQQDNSSISTPSQSEKGAIPWMDSYPAGTGESGHIVVHPQDANIVYVGAVGSSPGGGGALQRYDHRTKQIRLITVWPEIYFGWGAGDLKYRFAWTFPIAFSPQDPGVLYVTGNRVFRSTDEGESWAVISPDLTRADPETLLPSGGPITLDTSGAEHYATIYAFSPSPHQAGVLWAGSDDGLLHISQDDGSTWQNITPPDLQPRTLICNIELSPHDPATAYVAATRYKLDDYRPYLWKTTDYGQSWCRIDGSFPQDSHQPEVSRVIREDPERIGLLYVGTESGIFVSPDDGASWTRLHSSLPRVPVYDLQLKEGGLVVGTHGRAFWILDDLTPLRHAMTSDGPTLFPPRDTVRQWLPWSVVRSYSEGRNYRLSFGIGVAFRERKDENNQIVRTMLDSGENPPDGVILYYALGQADLDSVSLTIRDEAGQAIKRFSPRPEKGADEKQIYLPATVGLNRFVWDLMYPDAETVPGDKPTENTATGPRAKPGVYQAELTVGETMQRHSFRILPDPRMQTPQADFDAQFELTLQIRDKIDETHKAINRLRRVRGQVGEWTARVEKESPIAQAAQTLQEKLTAVEDELIQTHWGTAGDRLRMPSRLNMKLISLLPVVNGSDNRPTRQSYAVFADISARINDQLESLDQLVQSDVAAFNQLVKESGLDAVGV